MRLRTSTTSRMSPLLPSARPQRLPRHRLHAAGASTGARGLKPLQIASLLAVSKAVRGHWPLEGSNPSPSALAQKPFVQAVSGLCSTRRRADLSVSAKATKEGRRLTGWATSAAVTLTAPMRPSKSIGGQRRPLISCAAGARLAHASAVLQPSRPDIPVPTGSGPREGGAPCVRVGRGGLEAVRPRRGSYALARVFP
jgi:hypothetical protein